MKKFLILYFASKQAMETMKDMTEEQQEEDMALWLLWMWNHKKNMVDEWNPVWKTYKYDHSWISEWEHKVVWYSIMQWENIDKIYWYLETNPHVSWHEWASIEISEIVEMM